MRPTTRTRSEQVISALGPASAPVPRPVAVPLAVLPARRLRGLPEPPLSDPVVGMARVDRSGRLSARALLAALRWCPGTRVDVDVVVGPAVIQSVAAGRQVVSARGVLALPVTVRRWCDIASGSPVVVAAYLSRGVVVQPVDTVARLLRHVHGAALGDRRVG